MADSSSPATLQSNSEPSPPNPIPNPPDPVPQSSQSQSQSPTPSPIPIPTNPNSNPPGVSGSVQVPVPMSYQISGSNVVCSQSLAEETTNIQRQRLVAGTLTYPPLELPTIPSDLLPEILCWLPVKSLGQLRCVCKSFNSLISDPNFAKKHLRMSTKRRHIMLTNYNPSTRRDEELVMYDSPIPLPFSTSAVFTQTQLHIPTTLTNGNHVVRLMCCCDGMFCGKLKHGSYFVWNPSITKFKLLPPLESDKRWTSISFGYDHFIDNYKLIVVSFKNEVFVYTLGTDYWTRIEDIPYSDNICGQGVFVSGTLNWLANGHSSIISLDLKKELYQNLSLPDSKIDSLTLGVVRNCLCIFASRDMFLDVWIMNEYGNEKSWTKLYTVPSLQDYNFKAYNVLYISDHNQLLVECYEMGSGRLKLVVYDSKTGTLNSPEFQNNYEYTKAKVYVESLISP